MDRRTFLQGTLAGAATLAIPHRAATAETDLAPVWTQIEKHHDEAVQRLQEWIKQPSIAAENRGVNEGCDLTMRFLREAGFNEVTKIPTDGQPGIFAKLDAGAPKTLGLYFMYDVKQADPAEGPRHLGLRHWSKNPVLERWSSAAAPSTKRARSLHSLRRCLRCVPPASNSL